MQIKSAGINDKRFINNDFHSDEYLQVNSCGYYKDIPECIPVSREVGRRDYQIIITINGKVSLNNFNLDLCKNEIFVLSPKTPNSYTYSPDTFALWVHFTGSKVCDILSECGISPNQKYLSKNSYECFFIIEKMIDEFNRKDMGYMNNCNAYLLNLLTMIGRNIHEQKTRTKDSKRVEVAIKQIRDNLALNKPIKDYADMLCLSESRFSHIFKENTGVSPQNYIINLKIDHAKHLLISTDMDVSSVAKMLGYDDSLYFSRLFKKHTGLSPLNYRKANM